MHKSSADNLDLDPRYLLLEVLDSGKDPSGSYSMMSRVLEESLRSSYVHIEEWGYTIVVIPKTRALCAVQVRNIIIEFGQCRGS